MEEGRFGEKDWVRPSESFGRRGEGLWWCWREEGGWFSLLTVWEGRPGEDRPLLAPLKSDSVTRR